MKSFNSENHETVKNQGLKADDESTNYSYRINKIEKSTDKIDNEKLVKNKAGDDIKPQSKNDSPNHDKIRMHINRSMEVLDMIKNDTIIKGK